MLARMAQDMRNIVSAADSNAKFTTPAPVGNVMDWMNGYLTNSNGGSLADVIAFHGYVSQTCGTCPMPEDVVGIVQNLQTVMTNNGQGNKPMFDTEGSWGSVNKSPAITDPQQQAAFAARYYLLQMGAGVAKLYWYGWDFKDSGEFFDTSTQSLNPAGVAYQQIVKWTTGATVELCTQNGSAVELQRSPASGCHYRWPSGILHKPAVAACAGPRILQHRKDSPRFSMWAGTSTPFLEEQSQWALNQSC